MRSGISIETQLHRSRSTFEHLQSHIAAVSGSDEKVKAALRAITFATTHSTGYYSSHLVENAFIQLAQQHSISERSETFDKNTFLHVMTKSHPTGGHTRLVDRWISSAQRSESHSIVFTGSSPDTPHSRLEFAARNTGGRLHHLGQDSSILARGLSLRRFASSFEKVVLHVHMHDVVPLIAFGTKAFTRPVIFVNHADHLFWVGLSIADVVVQTRSWGEHFMRLRRGSGNSFILGLPRKAPEVNMSRGEARRRLKLPHQKKIMVTAGHPHKYYTWNNNSFAKTASSIMDLVPDSILVAIGPCARRSPDWCTLCSEYSRRVITLPTVPPETLYMYFRAADLTLDSFPMSGGTALSDAVAEGSPVLCMDCVTGNLDSTINSPAFCGNSQNLITKAQELLCNPSKARKHATDVNKCLAALDGPKAWSERRAQMESRLPAHHSLNSFTTPLFKSFSDLDRFICVCASHSRRFVGWSKFVSFFLRRYRNSL